MCLLVGALTLAKMARKWALREAMGRVLTCDGIAWNGDER